MRESLAVLLARGWHRMPQLPTPKTVQACNRAMRRPVALPVQVDEARVPEDHGTSDAAGAASAIRLELATIPNRLSERNDRPAGGVFRRSFQAVTAVDHDARGLLPETFRICSLVITAGNVQRLVRHLPAPALSAWSFLASARQTKPAEAPPISAEFLLGQPGPVLIKRRRQSCWEAYCPSALRGSRFDASSGVRRPYYGTALKAVVIFAIPPASALPIPVLVSVPYAASTAVTMQTATITYSNDTTPSLSLRRRFKASILLT
jgi:hypothetical protein